MHGTPRRAVDRIANRLHPATPFHQNASRAIEAIGTIPAGHGTLPPRRPNPVFSEAFDASHGMQGDFVTPLEAAGDIALPGTQTIVTDNAVPTRRLCFFGWGARGMGNFFLKKVPAPRVCGKSRRKSPRSTGGASRNASRVNALWRHYPYFPFRFKPIPGPGVQPVRKHNSVYRESTPSVTHMKWFSRHPRRWRDREKGLYIHRTYFRHPLPFRQTAAAGAEKRGPRCDGDP